jgi:hypothetical protein
MLSFNDCKTRANVVKIEKFDKYSVVKLRTARKDKKTDEWVNSQWAFVKFLGEAHKNIDALNSYLKKMDKFEESGDAKRGVPVLLKSVQLGNEAYMKEGKKTYPKNYQIVVWDWDFGEGFIKEDNQQPDESSSEEEFPF